MAALSTRSLVLSLSKDGQRALAPLRMDSRLRGNDVASEARQWNKPGVIPAKAGIHLAAAPSPP
jgi:hypothetical protein